MILIMVVPESHLRETLQNQFGSSEFRPQQLPIVQAILAGHDVLALLPTGSGKSICFQLPAVFLPGVTVVLSPLVSLMEDQVNQLHRRGIQAAFWNHTTSKQQERSIKVALTSRSLSLLYLSPEKLSSPAVQSVLQNTPVSAVIVDEAHCITEWGAEFRPQYQNIPHLISALRTQHGKRPPCAAFTATADARTTKDISRYLALRQPHQFSLPYYRPNLQYIFPTVTSEAHKRKLVLSILAHWKRTPHPQRTGLIYAGTRVGCEFWSRWLQTFGYQALPFHAGMSTEKRTERLQAFLEKKIHWLVTTSAFGMGIDIPHIGTVVHVTPPLSLTEYAQESGRAGRDGQAAQCIFLYRTKDLTELLEQRNDGATIRTRQQNRVKAQELHTFATQRKCLPLQLARAFRLKTTQQPHWQNCTCSRCVLQFPWEWPLHNLWKKNAITIKSMDESRYGRKNARFI